MKDGIGAREMDSRSTAMKQLLSAVKVNDLGQRDLNDVARVHVKAFPESVLTKLGHEAVRRYYLWQLLGPHDCQAVGVYYDQQLAGYCFGGVFHGALSGFLNTNRVFLAVRLILRPHLVLNSLIRKRIARALPALRRGTRRSKKTEEATARRSFGILAIAVDPERQGEGLGSRLMQEAENRALERGFASMHLTVSPENSKAVRFYEQQGWSRVLEDSKWTGQMRKPL